MSARVIGWNEWFSERSSGHDPAAGSRRQDGERPRYQRGSGLKVVICHKEHDDANYYVRANQDAGNEVFEDDKGNFFVLVCRY